jgi:sugar/nucleoside kinase (ribokinase family)
MKKTILGFGFSGVDYIATVSKFPSPDDKIRTLGGIKYDGGGNCGNTMSTVGKLGSSLFKDNNNNIQSKIITKIAADNNGDFAQIGLKQNHINIDDIIISPAPAQTGFVYVIVDNDTKTRTCIATLPNSEITKEEIINRINNNILKNVSFIHFDSRHTEAALKLASLASSLSIPISIDLEKDRPPYLRQLLPYCNIVFR